MANSKVKKNVSDMAKIPLVDGKITQSKSIKKTEEKTKRNKSDLLVDAIMKEILKIE